METIHTPRVHIAVWRLRTRPALHTLLAIEGVWRLHTSAACVGWTMVQKEKGAGGKGETFICVELASMHSCTHVKPSHTREKNCILAMASYKRQVRALPRLAMLSKGISALCRKPGHSRDMRSGGAHSL